MALGGLVLVLSQVEADLRTAFGWDETVRIGRGTPAEAVGPAPCAVIYPENVAREFAGVRVLQESYRLLIMCRFPIGEDEDVLSLQIARAQELEARLTPPGTTLYAGAAMQPLVASIEFTARAVEDAYYQIVIEMTCFVHVAN